MNNERFIKSLLQVINPLYKKCLIIKGYCCFICSVKLCRLNVFVHNTQATTCTRTEMHPNTQRIYNQWTAGKTTSEH